MFTFVGFEVTRYQRIWVQIDHIETRGLIVVGCTWTNNEIHPNWVSSEYISLHLVLFLVVVAIHAPSTYGLVPIQNSM